MCTSNEADMSYIKRFNEQEEYLEQDSWQASLSTVTLLTFTVSTHV